MQVEILIGSMSSRGRCMMEALRDTARQAGVDAARTESYRGDRPILLTYGLGDPSRFLAFKQHRAKGGRVVIADCGYWSRKGADKSLSLQRFAVDDMHCDRMLYAAPRSLERLRQYGATAKDYWNPDGAIVVIGMGRKGCLNAGCGLGEWEAKALEIARRRWPDKRIWYRPKVRREGFPPLPGADAVKTETSIYDVIHGASLVLCQHSNVAVDAIVAGIPVLAEAGAACALVGYGLENEPRIYSIPERQRFLEHLASWQWTPQEAAQGKVWPFLLEALTWTQANSISGSHSSPSATRPTTEAAE
jgi:hypothetical protein